MKIKKQNINYQEPTFGHSLLMMTVINQQYKICEKLLKLGANPNLHDYYSGTSAIIDASRINNDFGDNTKFIKLLLKYGANPSDVEMGARKDGNSVRNTPLMATSNAIYTQSPVDKVKVLVEAGANINYIDEYGNSILKDALMLNNLDVVYYLLQKGADYSGIMIDRSKYTKDGTKLYIQDYLNEKDFPKGSKNYRYKLKIIEFLKAKGVKF